MNSTCARRLGVKLPGLLLCCALFACAETELDRERWIERGRTAIQPFKQGLKSALVEALEDGPENAIDVCRIVAPQIAEDAGSDVIRVGRTSHKLRNPDNAPPPWTKEVLERYVADSTALEPEVFRLPGGSVGYVEPIYVQPLCLSCHGRSLDPSVSDRIEEHYPTDQARGFENGDFRGLFWVELAGD